MDRLYDKLISYVNEDYYPMHMPGHKRNETMMQMVNPYKLDITEIDGFDNLHQPEGILKDLSGRIEQLYGARKSFPLVNGSSAGILAGISAATRKGEKILIARNSHKSVYHAVTLMGLEPIYIYPAMVDEFSLGGGISARETEELLINNSDIRLVVITSPSYEGVVSDIGNIAEAAHRHGALLFVDEAHGAHFGFHEGFPKSALSLGADLVVQSLHKTLPSFTQTAVLHSNHAELNNKLQQYLAIFQSSSPSYLLMAGMDRCISMLEDKGKELFQEYYEKLAEFSRSMRGLKRLKLAGRELVGKSEVYDFDLSKIMISVRNTDLTGHQLMKKLHDQYHIDMEMPAPDHILGMTSICDTQDGFSRLKEALITIDSSTRFIPCSAGLYELMRPVQVIFPGEAVDHVTCHVNLNNSIGKVSAVFISLFPPGSPLIVPGERIEEGMIRYLQQVKKDGITITGLSGNGMDEIEVCACSL